MFTNIFSLQRGRTGIIAGVMLLVLLALSCGGEGAAPTEGGTCNPVQDMTITNVSEYVIKNLYAHDSSVFHDDPTQDLLGSGIPTGDSVTMTVNDYGETHYFTFVRDIFKGATIEIAVTTAKPITIEECYTYTLYLLEEEFSVETADNFAK